MHSLSSHQNLGQEEVTDSKRALNVIISHCQISSPSLCADLSLNASIYFQLNARSGGDGRGTSRHLAWGILTLSFAWLPGLVVVIISATERQWDGKTKWEKLSAVCGYILLILGWPLFAIMM